MRRTIDLLLPLLIGIIIGALGALSAITGRISTLEAESRQHGEDVRELKQLAGENAKATRENGALIDRLLAQVSASTLGARFLAPLPSRR
jgi:hypothetical protein